MRRGFLKPNPSQLNGNTHRASRSSQADKSSMITTQAVDKTLLKSAPLATIPVPHGPVIPVNDYVDSKTLMDWHTDEANAGPDGMYTYRVTSLPIVPRFSSDRMTACIITKGAKEGILALPGFPSPYSTISLVREGPATGAGLGLFATTARQPGDCIISERPLLILPRSMMVPELKPGVPNVQTQMVQGAINKMRLDDRARFLALKNCKSGSDVLTGILDTNAMQIGPLPGYPVDHVAICATTSRINHSCSPNAVFAWDVNSFTCFIRALKPIAAGDEITITYTYPLAPRTERQEDLRQKYAFTCTCETCSLPPTESKRSDVRRKILAMFEPHYEELSTNAANTDRWYEDHEASLRCWVEDVSLPDNYITRECLRLVEMLDAETWMLESSWPWVLQKLVKACCALEDREGAQKWANRAAEMCRARSAKGDDCGWEKVASHPERTEYWGLRVKMRARDNSTKQV